ncbi:MAG: phosphoribosylformylglycinamidine cyclo-ligase [SAR202 cluster bacterium]|nr:phosphoribosylformylglycinamidine cyclo-ligase [SAR202 cluster bacterium]
MPAQEPRPATYTAAGVDTNANVAGLGALLAHVKQTLWHREGAIGASTLPIGFFASVLRLTPTLSLAISTDGVGSKSIVAQLTGRYESIGWDCVAVNVNDIICVGAEPIALVDYISYQQPHADMLDQLGRGMRMAAERARIGIVGGEMSQHPDSLAGPVPGRAFDIAGTCVGALRDREPIIGTRVRPGDAIIGIASDGIHANGLTLARRVLIGDDPESVLAPLPATGRTVGEELGRPTHIYVPEVMALLDAGIDVRGLAHISGDGLLNLNRLDADVCYDITDMPPVPPVFEAIQRAGSIDDTEMWRVFNMGVGFCAVVPEAGVASALDVIRGQGSTATVIGRVIGEKGKRVYLRRQRLVGQDGERFEQA